MPPSKRGPGCTGKRAGEIRKNSLAVSVEIWYSGGWNQDGKAVFANKRGTYDLNGKGFKCDVIGSDKSVAFRLPCEKDLDWVAVFEAPINLIEDSTMTD